MDIQIPKRSYSLTPPLYYNTRHQGTAFKQKKNGYSRHPDKLYPFYRLFYLLHSTSTLSILLFLLYIFHCLKPKDPVNILLRGLVINHVLPCRLIFLIPFFLLRQ